jgi:hypothetical protein
MNKDELEASLIELDKALAKEFPGPEPMQCLVVGGACLILQEVTDRATEDIDVIIFNLMGSEESTLIFKTPLALKIRRIIKRIGKQYGLKGEHQMFLNDDCSPFLLELSRNELPEMRLLKKYNKLHLYVPNDLKFILACKLMASRPAKDHDDIRVLCQRLSIQTRKQAQAAVNLYFPYIADQLSHQLPNTLEELFEE